MSPYKYVSRTIIYTSNKLSEALTGSLRPCGLVYAPHFAARLPGFLKTCPVSAKFGFHIWPLTADLSGIRLQPFDYSATSSTDDLVLVDMVFFQQPLLSFSFS